MINIKLHCVKQIEAANSMYFGRYRAAYTGEGAEFQPIDLENVFDELSASVEGSADIVTGVVAGKPQFETRDKKDIVKKYESLEVINDNITSPRTQKVKDLVKKYEAL